MAEPNEYVTLDSGDRQEFSGGGMRDSEDGKPRFDLLVPENQQYEETMLYRWAALMGRGAAKYAARNWEQFSDQAALDRARSSAFRHFMQWFSGETDEDHAAAVFFNVTAAEYVKGRLDKSRLNDAPLGHLGFHFPEELRSEIPAMWEIVWPDGKKTKETGTVSVAKVPSWWDGEELDPWDESGKDEEG